VWFLEHSGAQRSRDLGVTVATVFQTGDRIDIGPTSSFERVTRPFPIGPGVAVPPGAYDWNGITTRFSTFTGRRISGGGALTVGDFYDGTRRSLSLNGDIRPGRMVSFAPTYQINDVDIRAGSFVTHLVGLRVNVSLSTNLLTSAYLQYNSAGQLAATQVRLNYIFRTIDNLYVVFNDTHFTDGIFRGKSNRSLVTKITYSLHR
jgi:hypothetical protein